MMIRTLPALLGAALLGSLLTLIVMSWPPARWEPPTESADALLTAVAHRHVHGGRDDHEPIARLSEIAATRRVVATCGPVSVWAVGLLRDAGYEARVVTTLTMDEWDSLDNGHTMVSVMIDGQWAVYDLDRKVRYTALDGSPLSIAELVERVPTDDYAIVPLGGPVGEGFLRAANRRLLQTAGIGEGEHYYFAASGEDAERVESYSPWYRALDATAWLDRFYDSST